VSFAYKDDHRVLETVHEASVSDPDLDRFALVGLMKDHSIFKFARVTQFDKSAMTDFVHYTFSTLLTDRPPEI
jgi:hypothetical protein